MTNKTVKIIPTKCAICNNSNNYTVLYKSNFSPSDFTKEVFSARRLPDRIHYQMVRCNKDGLVRSNPVLSEEALAKLYTESAFTYTDETENLIATYMASLEKVLPVLSKQDKLLEIGGGNGFLLRALYDRGYKQVYGIEPSTQAVNLADKKIRKNMKVAMLKPGLFPAKTFNLIFFFQTLDHIADPNTFLATCYRLLKPGGYILAFNHNVESLSARILREKSPIIDIEHTYLYSLITSKKLFEKHNFSVIDVYSPPTVVSLRHLLWLLPIPKLIKADLKGTQMPLLNSQIKVKLGNLCLIAKK